MLSNWDKADNLHSSAFQETSSADRRDQRTPFVE
jgi:hypothetical protein